MNERERGDKWAAKLRALGAWVQKLPSSSMAGIPDWLVVYEHRNHWDDYARFVEAKRLEVTIGREAKHACTLAQRFFLNAVDAHGGCSSVLVLDDEGYAEFPWPAEIKVTRELWGELRQPYE